MVLHNQCEYVPTGVMAISKGALAQLEGRNDLTDIDYIASLELQYLHQCVATRYSCMLTLSSSRCLGDHHAVMTKVALFLTLGQLSGFPTVDNHLECLALVFLSDTDETQVSLN